MKKQEIANKLEEWWQDLETCSGDGDCDIKECDLCFNCFNNLCNRLGCKLVKGDVVEAN